MAKHFYTVRCDSIDISRGENNTTISVYTSQYAFTEKLSSLSFLFYSNKTEELFDFIFLIININYLKSTFLSQTMFILMIKYSFSVEEKKTSFLWFNREFICGCQKSFSHKFYVVGVGESFFFVRKTFLKKLFVDRICFNNVKFGVTNYDFSVL